MSLKNIATIETATLEQFGLNGKLLGSNSEGKAKNLPISQILGVLNGLLLAITENNDARIQGDIGIIDDGGENSTKTINVTGERAGTYSVGMFYLVDNSKPWVYRCTAKNYEGDSRWTIKFVRMTGVAQALNYTQELINNAIGELIDDEVSGTDVYSKQVTADEYDNYTIGNYYKVQNFNGHYALGVCDDKQHSGETYVVHFEVKHGLAQIINSLLPE